MPDVKGNIIFYADNLSLAKQEKTKGKGKKTA